ncbi:conserved hypothetical protein [Roseibium sp. TrichSKD4]|uniref:DUF6665 family protein n=1 Tax=Roseibium sp. TrichSKD4 TaxID=744980 RepID=UPI0001E568C1|nr:DUF6665 family protein [Roseibium sp. TrichSKD4]EFO31799.1 conserved hypothetical protein [Roseibium sp. TrichSKD4]
MSVRPPRTFEKDTQDPLSAALEQDILSEKIGTLTRLNKKLELALEKLTVSEHETAEVQQVRLAEAGEALWHVLIQREMCGFMKHNTFLNQMNVPSIVRLNAGPMRTKR